MSFSAGTRLGPYEITGKLGAGGMGDVYRATDTRLDRIVALKVSKSEFGERFDREARAVAALNHPHICQLYDVGPNYLVMEYLEGIPLQGPLPLAKAIEYAVQILDALDAAHRKGITHRDLKPANILVTKQGIKLLDFGLAKQAGIGLKESDATLTEALTSQGQILGTLQYMSPEQLQGHSVDTRSDIFSFGLVFYEMITGRRAFDSASGASLIAAVLKDQPPPISEVLPDAPSSLERVISMCLEKDPDDRWQNARDLCRELSWSQQPESQPAPVQPRGRRTLWIGLASIPVALALGFVIARWTTVERAETLDAIPLTTYAGIEAQPALSPDGKLVAFTWTGPSYGANKICVKQLDASEPLVLSHGNATHGSPAWSPDGRQVAFLRDGDQGAELILVPSLGGPERKVGKPLPSGVDGGMCWLPIANRIILSTGGLTSVAVDTGESVSITHPRDVQDFYPALSPDGRNLSFVRTSGIAEAPSQIMVLGLDGRQQPQGEPKAIATRLQGVAGVAWAPDGRSLIVPALNRGSNHLFRVHFPDGKTERMSGVSLTDFVGGGLSISSVAKNMAISVSEFDVDIWRIAGPAWPDAGHRPEPERFIASTRDDVSPDYSPDGKRIAFESRRTGSQEIWSVDAEGHDAVQITNFGGAQVGSPRWSPDGSKIAFDSRKFGTGDIFIVSANGGTATRLTADGFSHALPEWSQDGRWIYCRSDRSGQNEIWKFPVDGGQAVQVTRDGAEAMQHASGDPWVYWWAKSGIWRGPQAGGAPEKVIDYGGSSFWAPWHDGIVLVGNGFTVYSLRIRDRKVTALQVMHPESTRFLRRPTLAVSPDGRWVLITMTALDRGDLMLVEDIR